MTIEVTQLGWNRTDTVEKRGKFLYVLCICACGNRAFVREYDLLSGASKKCRSCGTKEREVKAYTKTKGKYHHIPKNVFEKIKRAAASAFQRCTNKNSERYNDWGGRGIEVRFSNVEEFITHLLTLPGHDDFSLVIDRIDNDGHYEVGNLRFVTRSESQSNQRKRRTR